MAAVKGKLAAAALILLVLLAGCGTEKTVTVQGAEYPVSTTCLDLSGRPLTDTEGLFQLTGLQELNLLDTGIPLYTYQALHEALPECDIRWSVPFQGGFADSGSTCLTVSELSEADVEMLAYFPRLQKVDMTLCRNLESVKLLREQRPELELSYRVWFGDRSVSPAQTILSLSNMDVTELEEKLPMLPCVTRMTLYGDLPEPEALLRLMEKFPEVCFRASPVLGGVTTSLQAETLDLTGASFADTETLEAWLPCYPNLRRVELGDSDLPNEELDRLNKRFPEIAVVWNVSIGPIRLSTDATYFMPNKLGIVRLPSSDFYNLRYCTELVMIDLGHFEVYNVDFVEYLPKLEYLLLCESRVKDISPIGKCTSLRYLELFLSSVSEFEPLLNLTNLEDLNLSFDPCYAEDVYGAAGDLTPLYQMTWLHRLWMPLSPMTLQQREEFREALPGTTIVFPNNGSTNKGWRVCPNYFAQRDIIGRYYMYK